MVPVVFVMWLLIVLFASLAAHVALRILIRRCPCARPTAFIASNQPLGKIQVPAFYKLSPWYPGAPYDRASTEIFLCQDSSAGILLAIASGFVNAAISQTEFWADQRSFQNPEAKA